MSFRSYSYLPVLALLVLLSGCSSQAKNVLDSARALFENNNAANSDYIASVPYASTLVFINDSQPMLFVLLRADRNPETQWYRLTWLSAEGDSIVTENGRIVHTTGFVVSNLEGFSSPQLPLDRDLTESSTWQATYDWSPGYRYGFTAQVMTNYVGKEALSTDLWQLEANTFVESVTFDALDAQFTNVFWFAPGTDKTLPYAVKSIQYLGPNMDRVELRVMKPFIVSRETTRHLD